MNLIALLFSWKWSSYTQRASQNTGNAACFMIVELICVSQNTPVDKCLVMEVKKCLTHYIFYIYGGSLMDFFSEQQIVRSVVVLYQR